ncbi:MAG: hypothetical protein QOB17_09950 [Nitrososphaeraceae archaeon]|nr:hypothetical protein [Nitrososphaeraceae archaeon]
MYVKLCRAMCKLFLVLVGKLKKFYSFEVGEMAFPNDELIPNTVVAIILYPIKLKKLSTVGTLMTKDNARSHQWNVNCTSVKENKRIFYILVITQIVKNVQINSNRTPM